MPVDLDHCLVVGISSRALFDLHAENEIFEKDGLEAYARYQREHENQILQPGSAFPLVKALLSLNTQFDKHRVVEVIIMSRNSADVAIRLFKSIQHHGLDITRAAFTNGESLVSYLGAFKIDLYLSRNEADVQAAVNAGHAGAVIYDPPDDFDPATDSIRVAFDGDAVLFNSHESARVFLEQGAEAFDQFESDNAENPLPEGPFSKFFKTLSFLQSSQFDQSSPPVRIALVTARGSPAHERVIRTLRSWDIHVDEAFFLGGLSKEQILKAFRAHIFFDDQESNLIGASRVVPSARVPSREEELPATVDAAPAPRKKRKKKKSSG